MAKRALITGITGQDGSYLAELLLNNGYEVHGLVRRIASEDQEQRFSRISHLVGRLRLHYGDITTQPRVSQLIQEIQPHEIYHLAAQSQVAISFEDSFGAFEINQKGTHYLLEATKTFAPWCRFYFAGTSEMFGSVGTTPQSEATKFQPVSPYGISKVGGFYLTRMYREAYGLHASAGILFNHESERRGCEFVTRKISQAAARIKVGLQENLRLGNIETKRDWGHAQDYVKAMWLMLQQEKPDDYVIGTGESHSIKEFLDIVFGYVGLDWQKYVIIDKSLTRPLDIRELRADPSKAKTKLGWQPEISFFELARKMIDYDLQTLGKRCFKML